VSEPTFRGFLSRSLDLLERESPTAYTAIISQLGEMSVRIEVDGERAGVHCVGRRLLIGPAGHLPRATAKTARRALLRLLAGKCTLADAILADEIELCGSVDDLITFYEALLKYFRGAVGSPGFPKLLNAFLDSSEPFGEHETMNSYRVEKANVE
jgi:hypothetical protein